jgi:hypothetical protein
MRALVVATLLAALVVPQALAQGNAGFTMGDIYATHEVLQKRAQTTSMLESPGSPLGQLSKASKKWIREETKRQSAEPTTADDLAASVSVALERDEAYLARSQRLDPMDITRIITLLIAADAEDHAISAMKKAQKTGDPAALQAAADRAARATQNRKDAGAMQTDVSMALAQM